VLAPSPPVFGRERIQNFSSPLPAMASRRISLQPSNSGLNLMTEEKRLEIALEEWRPSCGIGDCISRNDTPKFDVLPQLLLSPTPTMRLMVCKTSFCSVSLLAL